MSVLACERCQQPGTGRFCTICGGTLRLSAVAQTMPHAPHHAQPAAFEQPSPAGEANAFNWPFRTDDWLGSILLLCQWWVPLFGQMLAAGWSVEAVRLRGHSAMNPLPQPSNAAKFFGNGLLLLLVYFLFYVIPLLVLGWIIGFSWWLPIWKTIVWLKQSVFHEPHESAVAFFLRNGLVFLSDAAAPVVYVLLISPLVLAGRVRYALTGRLDSFFRFFANTAFCVRHAGDVLLYFFLSYLARFVIDLLVAFVVYLPLLGWLAALALVAAGCWMRAFWASNLACIMQGEFNARLQTTH